MVIDTILCTVQMVFLLVVCTVSPVTWPVVHLVSTCSYDGFGVDYGLKKPVRAYLLLCKYSTHMR